jgi:hypothetical protein
VTAGPMVSTRRSISVDIPLPPQKEGWGLFNDHKWGLLDDR